MANNPKRRGTGASQSFTKAEIEAVIQLMETAQRGGGITIIVRSAPIQKVFGKFKRMQVRLKHVAIDVDPEHWIDRVQELARGAEFYGPKDPPNPAPGNYTVVGPLTEYRHSPQSLAHAALLYLAQVMRDREAIEALRRD